MAQGTTAPLAIEQIVVGDDEVLVEHQLLAEAVAGRAGALRGVEAEQPRLDLGDGEAARPGRRTSRRRRCGRAAPKSSFMPDCARVGAPRRGSAGSRIGEALGELERLLEAVGEARLDAFADDDAVDHHLDVVLVLLVERGRVLDRVELAVDADAGEARLLPFGELLAVLALAAADDRGEQVMAAAFGQRPSPGRPSG